ncbi:MAG: hypothetical protein EA398_06150 [Deltaproteobacteria bacterium]|nr:MAG: hypothetical protein EA398_06150 [Deltaproteobacteria bacterium]
MNTTLSPRRLRTTVSLVVLGLVLSIATVASALSRDDIYTYLNQGLPPDTIVSIVRGTTAPVTITEGEVIQMRQEGVPESILGEICSRIGCSPAAAPGPAPGPGVGPSLDQERERQRQLEEQRQREEAERLEQERERLRQDMQREATRAGQVDQLRADLSRARAQFRSGLYLEAAMTYNAFIEGAAPAEDSDDHYEALAGYVRSMHAAGIRHVIRQEALDLVLFGASRPHFEEAFAILDDVVRDSGYRAPRIEELTGVSVATTTQGFQDRWNFFLGRYFWNAGDMDRALQFFARVSDDSPDRARAHYIAATIQLDRQENTRAIASMQQAVLSAIRLDDQEVYELAYLALARVNYERGFLDVALFYYNKLPSTSPRRGRVIFESAWTHFLREDFNRSLGLLHAMHSPYLDHWFWPDLFVLEAASYLTTCNLDDASRAIEMFDRTVPVIHRPLRAFLNETEDPVSYWNAIAEWHERAGTPDQVGLPIEAVRSVLKRPSFRQALQTVRNLEAELEVLRSGRGALGELGEFFESEIEANLTNRRIDGGLQVSAYLFAFSDELNDWQERAREVEIEITTALIQQTRATREGQVVMGEGATSAFVLARDWQTWPFEGEYWLDEIGSYRADLIQFRDRDTDTCLLPMEEE